MQTGQIIRRGKQWAVRYNEKIDGKWIKKYKTICPVDDTYRTEDQVKQHPEVLKLVGRTAPAMDSGVMTFQKFIDDVYMPWVEANKKPSTVKGYRNLYYGTEKNQTGIRRYVGDTPVNKFGIPAAQQVINAFKEARNPTTRTLSHIKAFLMAAVWHAIRKGYFGQDYVGGNPLAGESLNLSGRRSNPTHAYSSEEFTAMLEAVSNQTYKDIMIVAAFTGLRSSEIRGLRWADINFEDSFIEVNQSFWGAAAQTTKTESSQAKIPMISQLAETLRARRKENPDTTYVFEGPHLTPLYIDSIGSKKIKSILEKNGQTWHGWHAYRRGLATMLRDMGIAMETTSAIMRHSDVKVTMAFYAKPSHRVNAAAMQKLSDVIKARG